MLMIHICLICLICLSSSHHAQVVAVVIGSCVSITLIENDWLYMVQFLFLVKFVMLLKMCLFIGSLQ